MLLSLTMHHPQNMLIIKLPQKLIMADTRDMETTQPPIHVVQHVDRRFRPNRSRSATLLRSASCLSLHQSEH